MRKILLALAALMLASSATYGQAVPGLANVVSACGTPPSTYAAGQNRPVLQNTNGQLCGVTSASGTVTANQGAPAVQNSTNAWPVIVTPSAISAVGNTPVQSASLETGHVIKGSPGELYDFNVSADATLSSVSWAVMIFNSTTVPASGTVAPVKCYLVPIGVTSVSGSFTPAPLYLGTGISIAVSTGATCFTKTDSAHGFISADAQ